MVKQLLVIAVALVLSGCAGVNLDQFQNAEIKGSAFTQNLVKEYKDFVKEEADQYDWTDANHFAQKGLRVLAGEDVAPENPADWNTPDNKLAEMNDYFHRLDYILNNGAKKSSPQRAARAMAKFDCWVEQQEENWQPKDIAECRSQFMQAFAELERAEPKLAAAAKKYAASKPVAKAKSPQSRDGVVYFDFNSAKLGGDDVRTVRSVAKEAGKKSRVQVEGHTDTAGSEAYNRALSHRRAMAVRQVLIESGVGAKNVRILAKGESDLAVQTADNVREPKNRRVEMQID